MHCDTKNENEKSLLEKSVDKLSKTKTCKYMPIFFLKKILNGS
jgi:hypothetical protein